MENKGFTLIELLVIISITILMTVMVFSNYGKNNEIFALERSAQKIYQDIRRVQEMAMSGFEGSVATTGYGVYFNMNSTSSYLVYEEQNSNMWYESETDIVKETINLEKEIIICALNDNTNTPSVLSVSFEPPNPLTYVGGVSSAHEAIITLCVASDTTKKKYIKINNVGRVEIVNTYP
ncbi:type II secretion system GspH family protein [bacterium]|jgi:type II secretory pathway pseudopilin PulG|nr:type II secretion system GspH family protein [bacterium]